MMDRFNLIIEVPEISASTLLKEASGESSQIIAKRVAAARQFGARRNQGVMRANAHISIGQLDQQICGPRSASNSNGSGEFIGARLS